MVVKIASVVDDFVEIAHRVVWCSIATVDRRGRPRSRVLHPLWERRGDGSLVGWVTTRPTRLKVAHLAATPWVSCSYWSPDQDTAVAECYADWETDLVEAGRVWELFRGAPAPLGHDPGSIWPDGPGSEGAGLLRLRPWLLVTRRLSAMAAGERPRTWRPPSAAEDAVPVDGPVTGHVTGHVAGHVAAAVAIATPNAT